MFTEADRAGLLNNLGAEFFDTANGPLQAILEGEFNDPEISGISVEGQLRWLECRTSDVRKLTIVKNFALTRRATGEKLYVRRLEPSESTGFTVLRLSK